MEVIVGQTSASNKKRLEYIVDSGKSYLEDLASLQIC
jgi:hypothetical protein